MHVAEKKLQSSNRRRYRTSPAHILGGAMLEVQVVGRGEQKGCRLNVGPKPAEGKFDD